MKIENPSDWYGWIALTQFWGTDQKEEFYDAWGFIDMDAAVNKPYFEVMQDGYSEDVFLSMNMKISEDGTKIIPDIGDEDAWTVDVFLKKENAQDYEGVLNKDGSLTLSYEYVSFDKTYGCHVNMFLRPDGVLWDEEKDILPPRYDEFKAVLEKQDSSNVGAKPSQPSNPSEPTDKLPAKKLG